MDKATKRLLKQGQILEIHCACVIHDTKYDFSYVDKLYRGLCRNLTPRVILHVYTESNRPVPEPYVKHSLVEWPGVRGPKQSWWYKIQVFNPEHHSGQLLYFDLDTVIVHNIDWIWKLPSKNFWAVKDFKYLFRSRRVTLNSSVMWFDTGKYKFVYDNFDYKSLKKTAVRYHGDQDYIHQQLSSKHINYFDTNKIKSYRWQVKEGGYNFATRKHHNPGARTVLDNDTSILIFHGSPNPHECMDKEVQAHWI